MPAAGTPPDRRELLKSAFEAIEQLKAKVKSLESAAAEPIAIVGAGCRFPGDANSLDSYWALLRDGRDVVREVPADRWETFGQPRVETGWSAGLVDGLDQFDPKFFGISAREASTMDPQQRMVLEVGWEALENAGYPPDKVAGTKTGVFLGITGHDYADLLRDAGGLLDVYAATGNANNAAAGRLSFFLGANGPSVAVDTACSSSLVAIHLACLSLRAGDCTMAIAGGVNALLTPGPFECFKSWGMMAPDGRCKTFDARADGFVRGEGCGLIVLKKLSAARADGDRILAVIRGSAVNQDGRSSGLTVPNGPAQEAVVRQALATGQVNPLDIGYVEAHGTGTALGDPIEAHALAAVLGQGRTRDNPLVLGSVKTNIGHLESAAGVAGLLKVVLSLQHERIPAHLHFTTMNPDIDWNDVPVEVPVNGRDWRRGERRRLAGVSSFGFSGTNAHIVLEEAPASAPSLTSGTIAERPVHLLTLSARSEETRDALAQRMANAVAASTESLADLCYTANAGRAQFRERLAVVAATREQLHERLVAHQWIAGHAKAGSVRIAALFTGQGSQWAGMGRELYETQPVFRAALDECAAKLSLEHGLLDVLYGDRSELLHQTAYTQPALFALEWSLAQLWKTLGVEPTAVVGHSVGEYVALCVAGVWSLDDGLRLIAERGRMMQALGSGWGMTSVLGSRGQVQNAVRMFEPWVSIAAVNAPESIVISGRLDELRACGQQLEATGCKIKSLTVSHAFHSAQMDGMADAFARLAVATPMHEPNIRIVSSVTGTFVTLGELRHTDYWRKQVRNAVEFYAAMKTLAAEGYDTFLEIGPHPVLTGLGQQAIGEASQLWASSLHRDRGAWQQLLDAVGHLYVRGADVRWAELDRPHARRRASLPSYPFQRQRHWFDGSAMPIARRSTGHPLLGVRTPVAGATESHLWNTEISIEALPYLADHAVQGNVIVPATVYMEMAVAAAHEILGEGPVALTNAQFKKPLVLVPGAVAEVQVSLTPDDGSVNVYGRMHRSGPWTLIASCIVERTEVPAFDPPPSNLAERGQSVGGAELYEEMGRRGNQWGPTFRGVSQAWLGASEGWSHLVIPEGIANELHRYWMHPALGDASGHILTALTTGAWRVSSAVESAQIAPDAEAPVILEIRERGSLDNIVLVPTTRIPPGAGEVEIRVCATGMNFRDVLNTLGMYPGDAGALGGECAGVVTAVGEGVSELTVGDEVIAMIDKSFATYVIAPVSVTVRKPAALTFEEAATIPVAFLTAEYALKHLAKLERGERVMIHAVTGGVGMAALQIAKRDGATVFGTAGNPEKRALAASMGVDYVSDSRSLSFVDDFATATEGGGVDVVLNALANEFIPKSLGLLRAGGRFVEIGKAGVWDQARVSQEYPQVAYFVLYLGHVAATEPVLFRQMFLNLVDDFERGVLTPLPRRVYPLDQAVDAFRFMAQAKHVGKVIVVPSRTKTDAPGARSFVAQSFDRVSIYARPRGKRLLSGGWITASENSNTLRGDVRFFDEDGQLLSEVSGVQMRALESAGHGAEIPPPDQWYHRVVWKKWDWNTADESVAGAWTIVVSARPSPEQSSIAEQLKEAMRATGGDARIVSEAEIVQLTRPAKAGGWGGIVFLVGLDAHSPFAEHVSPARAVKAEALLSLVQTLSAQGVGNLWIVTRGVHVVDGAACGASVWQSPLWGLGRALAVEEPGVWGGLTDIDATDTAESNATALWRHLRSPGGEDQSALRAGKRFIARLERTRQPEARPLPVRADGAYLITGGLGGLGLEVAKWLVEHGARRLILWGRSPVPSRSEWRTLPADHPMHRTVTQIRALEAAGASVHIGSVDVADAESTSRFLAGYAADAWPPIRGIVHAAGVVSQQPLTATSIDDLDRILRPKFGAWLLHEAFAGEPLDFFVLFSSASALRPPPGLGAYAAANTFLDAIANNRAGAGMPGLSINWGAWGEIGMAARDGVNELGERGMAAMRTEQGLDAFARLLASPLPQAAVLPINWKRTAELFPSYIATPLYAGVLDALPSTAVPSVSARESYLVGTPDERRARLLTSFREMLGNILGFSALDVDAETSISAWGLDSLTAVEFRNRVTASVGVAPQLVRLLQGPTLTELANEVELQLALDMTAVSAAASNASTLAPASESSHVHDDGTGVFPLSRGQSALWFVQELFSTTWAYNLIFAGWLRPSVELAPFQTALAALVARHANLRAMIERTDGGAQYRVVPPSVPDLEIVDCTGWSDEAMRAAAVERHRKQFEVGTPLLRTSLLRRDGEDLFVMVIHHVILDAQSLQIIMGDLRSLYDTALRGAPSDLAPLPVHYADFVEAQNQLADGPAGDNLWSYWSQALATPLPVLDVPTTHERPDVVRLEGATESFTVDRETVAGLYAAAKRNHTTLFAVMMSATQVWLHGLSGQRDVIVGTPGSLRTQSTWSDLVGYFVNPLPIRGTIDPNESFDALLARTRDATIAAMAHQEYPFPLMVERLDFERTLSRSPIFQAMLSFHISPKMSGLAQLFNPVPKEPLVFGASRLTPMPLPQQEGQFELGIEVIESDGTIYGRIAYQTALYDAPAIAQMAAAFVAVLRAVAATPGALVSTLVNADRELLEF